MPPRYGRRHGYRREIVRRFVEAGQATCARCGEGIRPDEAWDLGHRDDDPSRYSGPEHRRCNRATAGRGNHRAPAEIQRWSRWSRCWCGAKRDPRCPVPPEQCLSGAAPP